MFFYKTDPVKNKAEQKSFDIFIEPYQNVKGTALERENDLEVALNSWSLEINGDLKCCISLGDDPRTHLFIFVVSP